MKSKTVIVNCYNAADLLKFVDDVERHMVHW